MSQGQAAQVYPYTVVSLQDVQTHLRMPPGDTSDDASLGNFINAATDTIQHLCGQVVPAEFDEYYSGGSLAIVTRHAPIISVLNVEEGWGYASYDLVYQQVNSPNAGNMFAYSIDDESVGIISRRTGGNVNIRFVPGVSNIRVTYVAGQATVPGAIRLAALELISHWWTGSQQRSAQYQSTGYDTTNQDFARSLGESGFYSGIPERVLVLLRPFFHVPFIGLARLLATSLEVRLNLLGDARNRARPVRCLIHRSAG